MPSDYLRRILGITDLEVTMSRLSEQLDQANNTLDSLKADVQVLLDRASVPAEDPEAQAAADRLSAFAEGWRSSTPDADGSDTPVESGDGDTQRI